MNTNEVLSYEMMVRVRDYSASRPTDFPPDSRGGQLFAEVNAVVTELSHQAMVQTTTAGGVIVNNAAKARLRASLREDLRALNRTARVITAGNPDLKKKFRIPKGGDQHLLSGARAFLEDAEPFKSEFPKHEVPADFLVKFKNDIDSFEAAVSQRNQSRESRVQATARLLALLSQGVKAVKQLDVIVRNKFRGDKPSLSAWESAKHVERNNVKSKDQKTTDQPNTDPVKPKSPVGFAAG